MPTYEFECLKCRKTFEITAPLSEYTVMRREKRILCPACGAKTVSRVFSAPGISGGATPDRPDDGRCCSSGRCR